MSLRWSIKCGHLTKLDYVALIIISFPILFRSFIDFCAFIFIIIFFALFLAFVNHSICLIICARLICFWQKWKNTLAFSDHFRFVTVLEFRFNRFYERQQKANLPKDRDKTSNLCAHCSHLIFLSSDGFASPAHTLHCRVKLSDY